MRTHHGSEHHHDDSVATPQLYETKRMRFLPATAVSTSSVVLSSSSLRPTFALVSTSPFLFRPKQQQQHQQSSSFLFPCRPIFFTRRTATTTTTTSTSSRISAAAMNTMIDTTIDGRALTLLESVYGPIDSSNFPLPMPSDEAGLCSDGYQRRYLWTDAFGVLAYTTIANIHEQIGNSNESQKYHAAATKLIQVVHQCLGTPAEDDYQMKKDSSSPTGYVGLRIGKVHCRKVTDYGMKYDGQYWHYVDKWLLALTRSGHTDDAILIAKSCFPSFFDPGPNDDESGYGGGMRWKLSIDSIPPPALKRTRGPNDDTLMALIVFSILEANRTRKDNDDDDDDTATPSLAKEIQMLKNALEGYTPRVTDDPLGWGLEAIFDQFVDGQPRSGRLAALQKSALHPSHLSLPFRLYGAIMGARVAGPSSVGVSAERLDKLVDLAWKHQQEAIQRGDEEHSSINRVMLAMVMLCPGALAIQPNDPIISL